MVANFARSDLVPKCCSIRLGYLVGVFVGDSNLACWVSALDSLVWFQENFKMADRSFELGPAGDKASTSGRRGVFIWLEVQLRSLDSSTMQNCLQCVAERNDTATGHAKVGFGF